MVAVAIERASTAIEIILAGGVLAGVVFTLYLRRVLTTAVGIVSCGCSPLGGPFTAASLLPAMLLSLLSALGLAAGLAGRSAGSGPILADPRALAGIGWGVTLAGLVLLFPASAPSVEAKGGLS
jgi:hypothetical protein